MEYILFISVTVLFTSIILNSFGVYLLHKVSSSLTNQKLLLTSLSFVEILFALMTITFRVMIHFKCESLPCDIVHGLVWYFYFVYIFIIFVIMLDRFIGGMTPLKYASMFPKRTARLMIMVGWILSLLLLVPRLMSRPWIEFCPITAVAVGFPVLLFIITAYSLMAFKIRKHRRTFLGSRIQSRVSKVAAAIIISFACLAVLPDFIVLIKSLLDSRKSTGWDQFVAVVYLLNDVNYLLDPVVYLYGYPALKAAIKHKIFTVI